MELTIDFSRAELLSEMSDLKNRYFRLGFGLDGYDVLHEEIVMGNNNRPHYYFGALVDGKFERSKGHGYVTLVDVTEDVVVLDLINGCL